MVNIKLLNRDNLIHNYNLCKNIAGRVMVMCKADAYGHGIEDVVGILKQKCNWFGVASTLEAIRVRRIAGDGANILVVSKSEKFDLLIKNNIHITVDDISEVEAINEFGEKLKRRAYVHIAINTGMNRIGVNDVAEFKKIIDRIGISKYITLVGVFTHMYDADENPNHYKNQIDDFKRYLKFIPKGVICHIGGSYCLDGEMPKFVDMVRVGFALYGYGNLNVRPVMSIWSRIIKISSVKTGENVGYGNNLLKFDKLIATIPLGYADGIPRRISKKGYVKICGKICKVVASVCMDCILVDVTKIKAKVGDKVLVMDDATKMAKWANTSTYEVLTGFAKARTKCLII